MWIKRVINILNYNKKRDKNIIFPFNKNTYTNNINLINTLLKSGRITLKTTINLLIKNRVY